MKRLTDPLFKELEQRMAAASQEHYADPLPPPPPQPPPDIVADSEQFNDVPDGPTVQTQNPRDEPLRQLHDVITEAHRTMKNLAGELNKRKLTEAQLKDLGVTVDWLFVTKSIATQYAQALTQMEKSLAELREGAAEYYADLGEHPEFLS